ncbi:MAG: ATP-binding protein [Desulfobacterales bacterium]|nr:ATP-binding protein [Desulfobacterales bacterium]
MWKQISLRIRIYFILITLVMITVLGGLVMVWYTYRMEGLLTDVIDRNVAGFQTAEALEIALINQKGFVSYYLQDRDPDWLKRLGEYRQVFKERLDEARTIVDTPSERESVNRIEAEYIQYVTLKDQVINYYKAGEAEKGAELHKQVRKHFFKVLELCEIYKDHYTRKLKHIRDDSYAQAQKLRIVAGTAIFIVLILAVFLAFVLVNNILGPVRRLVMEADRDSLSKKSDDEVKALSRSVRGLIENIDQTQSELEKSREHLLQAEKMVVVGQLAAGMAHSIRNPLTSVKMRLFSLHRALNLNAHQKEDFQVISEEILHIDNIVQNFLEFSRPPKLKMQKISPSEVVDLAFRLLRHRLESYNVEIKLNRKKILPEIVADPELLKEALVNIVVNACEAMKGGGFINIDEEEACEESLGRIIVIRLTDSGPGIPEAIQRKVFEPFFTTKEEGSGLGLSIAARIVEEHGGRLDLTSKEGEGSSFAITLPVNPEQ